MDRCNGGIKMKPKTETLPAGYQLFHSQIANFNAILAGLIEKEEKRDSSWMDLSEAKKFRKNVLRRKDVSEDATKLQVDYEIMPLQVKINTPDRSLYPAALYDLARMELYGLNHAGEDFLDRLMRETPVVVHWFGIGASNYWGQREMQLVAPDGQRQVIQPEALTRITQSGRLEPTLIIKPREGDDPQRLAVEAAIDGYLQKNPIGELVVHEFGKKPDFGKYYSHIPTPQGYVSVTEQFNAGVSFPPQQRANIDALMEMEQKNHTGKRRPYHSLYAYEHEKDRAVYYVFVGGEVWGFNNRRGAPGIIRSAQESNPGKSILAHRGGSPLDFDLASRLMEQAIPWLKYRAPV